MSAAPLSDYDLALRQRSRTSFGEDATLGDGARVVCLADVQPETVVWLWPGYVPLGKLTVLEGDPGLGKSTLALGLAAAVSRGGTLPGGGRVEPSGVVIITYEDGLADTIRPRLDAAGADVARVFAIQGVARPGELERLISFPDDAPAVFEAVARLNAKLVIVDPLAAALSSETDSHRDADVRRALAPLARFAEEYGVAVLVIRHLTKAASGRAIVAGGGSIAIAAAARSVIAVHTDPDHPEDAGARILASVKCNLTSRPPSLAFRLLGDPGESARVEWSGISTHTADHLAALRADTEGGADAEREIDAWVRSDLDDGPQDRREVLRRGGAAGFSIRSIERAAARLGVIRRQSGFASEKRSEWSIPSIPPNPANSRQYADVGAIGGIEGTPNPASLGALGAIERERCPDCGGSDLTWTPEGNVCENCPLAGGAASGNGRTATATALPLNGDGAGSAPVASDGPAPTASAPETAAVSDDSPAVQVPPARFIAARRPSLLLAGVTYEPGADVPEQLVSKKPNLERAGYVVRAEFSDAVKKGPVGEVPADCQKARDAPRPAIEVAVA